MRIALASCRELPAFEVDDRALVRALGARGVTVLEPAWDDPMFDWASCAACLIRTTWDYMERCPEFVAWAERVGSLTRLFNSSAVVRWNTDKHYLRELESAGIAVIPTVWVERGTTPELEELVRSWTSPRAFLKPTVGANASGTLRFDLDAEGLEAARAHLAARLPTQSFMLQPYLETVEEAGELSAILVDGRLTHGVRKIPVAGDYRVQDDFGARDERHEFTAEERALSLRIAKLAAEHLGEPELLYARVDYLRAADGRLLLNELELVEPSLFFRHAPEAAEALAEALLARLQF